ncbi:putative glyoxalase superfamily protein PhnB [Oxalobacteraceae bacterium GrIS 1.11]
MSAIPKNTKATVLPCLRYRDASAAIDWLCHVFGFERQLVVPNEDGSIAHAQLSFGNGMIMLGSIFDTEFGRLMKQPNQLDGANTQTSYLIVADADQVYSRAREAGAIIVLDIKDEDYGGRGFTCRDPEGHVWSLGTYDPWQNQA